MRFMTSASDFSCAEEVGPPARNAAAAAIARPPPRNQRVLELMPTRYTSEELLDQAADHVSRAADAESHEEHVEAAAEDAAAGEEAPRRAHAEVREHAHREARRDRG